MKEIYIIWNNSFEWDSVYTNSSILYITDDYKIAMEKFKECEKICSRTLNDPVRCYSYTLSSYPLGTSPQYGKCLAEVSNVSG